MSGIESVLEGWGGGEGGVRTNQSAGFPVPGEGSLRGAQLFKYRHPPHCTTFRAGAVNKKTIVRSVDRGVGDSNCSSRLGNEGDVYREIAAFNNIVLPLTRKPN